MANITVTHTFTNGTAADATEVNTNFSDIIAGTSDGTKDFSINALTVAGAATLNGNVDLGNATGDTITFNGRVDSDIDPSATATQALGSTSLAWTGIFLDNGATDGGAVYFNASATAFIKSDASAGDLDISGFTDVDFNSINLKGVANIASSGTLDIDTIDETTSTQGVAIQGRSSGSGHSAGYVGEWKTGTISTTGTIATSWTNYGSTMSLTAGIWMIGYTVNYEVSETGAGTVNTIGYGKLVSDPSGTPADVSGTEFRHGIYVANGEVGYYVLTAQSFVNISSTTTYGFQAQRSGNANENILLMGSSGYASDSQIWAVRVG